MSLEWSDDFCTGVTEVDAQHKALFGALNTLESLLDQGEHVGPQTEEVLSQIVRDITEHFAFEEDCMHRHKCWAAQMNERSHAAFLETLGRFQERIDDDGISESALREFHSHAENWFVLHICHADIHLRACVQGRQP